MTPFKGADLPKTYKYVGSLKVLLDATSYPIGTKIHSLSDLENWIDGSKQNPDSSNLIPATFVIDAFGFLRLAFRHSEHIACAGGKPLLSAGEIFFTYNVSGWKVTEITNQSTGFCPEPKSWHQVAKALDAIDLPHPAGFTIEFIFRRCPSCSQINLVKGNNFSCAVCGANLPLMWNFDS